MNNEHNSPPRPRRTGKHAFSLLELIAVLAVIAILASLVLPIWIKRIDIRTREQEKVKLGEIKEALTKWTLRKKILPTSATWSNAVPDFGSLSVAQAAANSRRFSRVYYTQGGSFDQQNDVLTARPAGYRAIVVSVLGGDALQPGVNCPDASISAADFQHLWDLPNYERPAATPGTAWETWKGRGDDVLIERIDYNPLFHRLILVNRDNVTPPPQYAIHSTDAMTGSAQDLTQTPGIEGYFMDGTVIDLRAGNAVKNRYILKRDISFVFEKGVWRSKIAGVPMDDDTANDFAAQAAAFMSATWNSKADKGANQQGIVTAMYTYMLTYTFWANRFPHFSMVPNASIQQVPEYIILSRLADPQKRMDVFAGSLLDTQGGP